MLRDLEFYHGVALARLVRASNQPVNIELIRWDRSFNSYVINGTKALYLKYNTSRLSPWQFVFTGQQLEELARLAKTYEQTVAALVCWEDGVVCLPIKDVQLLLGAPPIASGWISVSRKKNEQYRVRGSATELNRRVARKDFSLASFSVSGDVPMQVSDTAGVK